MRSSIPLYNKIFISYAKEDYTYAVSLFSYLESLAYQPWLDKKNILPGANWELEIERALKDSDFIIVLLSSVSVSKRGYVQKEYKMAVQYWEQRPEDDIYIIPVLIDACEVPLSLSRFQWVMFDDAFPAILHSFEKQRQSLTGKGKLQERPESGTRQHSAMHEFTDYDLTLITLLSQGMMQKHLPSLFQQKKLYPASLSSIEKRLNVIKTALSLSSNEQLVSFCQRMHLI